MAIDAGADLVLGITPTSCKASKFTKGSYLRTVWEILRLPPSAKSADECYLRVAFQDKGIVRAEIIPLNVFNREVLFQPTVLKAEAAEAVLNAVRLLSKKWQDKNYNGRRFGSHSAKFISWNAVLKCTIRVI